MSLVQLLYIQLALVLVIGVLHLVGFEYFLYWKLWWYDIILHALGGAWVAVATLWFFGVMGLRVGVWGVVFATLFVGAGWEAWEFGLGMWGEDGYAFDTVLDFCMDVAGALGALWIVRTYKVVQ
ncbi:MAG TPA: hypothetical protein VJH33_02315 [Candidatus Paceibacterota bacterium]